MRFEKYVAYVSSYTKRNKMGITIFDVDIEALTNRVIVIGHGKKLYDGKLNDIKKKFNNQKQVEIIFKKLTELPNIKNVNILKKNKNKVLLEVPIKEITISEVIRDYSKVCEIEDVNVLENNIDNVIVKLYEEYNL